MSRPCVHAADVRPVSDPLDVCEVCIEIGSEWVHLRQCLTCGVTRCCNDSPMRHMARHWHDVGHAVMRNADLEYPWIWCFEDGAPIEPADDGGWLTIDL